MTTRSVAQARHERIGALVLELDTDSCSLTFGIAPCTGTGEPCYNTFGTCKSKPNFTKTTKTFKFCDRGMVIPPGETLRPYISAHSFTPTEIPTGGGLAIRSHISLTLVDETCSDYEADKYALGGSSATAPVLAGSVGTGSGAYSVTTSGNYAYVVDYTAGLLQIFSIATPSAPSLVGSIATGSNPRWVHLSGVYAYVVNTGSNTLQIFDVTNPAAPSLTGSVATGSNPHAVSVSGNYAFVVNFTSNTMTVYDVTNKAAPSSAGSIASVTGPTSIAISGNYAYVTCATSSQLRIFDITAPATPTLAGSISTGTNPVSVSVAGNYAYVANYDVSTMTVYSVSNPAAPVLSGTATSLPSPTCVFIFAGYAYVACAGSDTIKILSVATPSAPVLIGSASTGSNPHGVTANASHAIIVNSIGNSLQTFTFAVIVLRGAAATGTFWTRFFARNYNTAGRLARIKKGYITNPFDWTVFQTELYVIDSIKGPDSNGKVQIMLSDAIRPLDKNLLPAPTAGKLTADFKAIEFTAYLLAATSTSFKLPDTASAVDDYYNGMEAWINQSTGAGQRRTITAYVGATRMATVAAWSVIPDITSVVEISALNINVGTGNGTYYANPASTGMPEYIAIGTEVIRYTAKVGDVLSWDSSARRAQFGTVREDHATDDGVQQCFAVIDQPASTVIEALCNASGVPDAYIDLTGLATLDTDYLGAAAILTACIPAPEKASSLLNELLRDLGIFAWWDTVAQKLKFKIDLPELSTGIKAITTDETILNTMQVETLDAQRITRAFISYAPYSATSNMTERRSFRITDGYRDSDAESANEYNGIAQSQIYSRWLSLDNQVLARANVGRKLQRLRNAPWRAKFKIDPRDEVALGDLIDLTTRQKTDASGAPVVTRMRVTKLKDDGNFDIEAISTNYGLRYGFIAPAAHPDYNVATEAQRAYMYICLDTGLMADGSSGYLFS